MLQSPHLWLEAPLPGSPTDEASQICLIQLLGFSIYEHWIQYYKTQVDSQQMIKD
jgi:hypothetical protein